MPSEPAFPNLSDHHPPAYVRVAQALQQKLSEIGVGERLPPERQLCVEFGVSRVTLRKAMEALHRQGFLETRRGGGKRLLKPIFAPVATTNPVARKLIGIIVPTVENSFISRIVRGAEGVATESQFHMVLALDHGDMDYQLKQIQRMIESDMGGFAVYPDSGNLMRPEFQVLIGEIRKSSIPFVMIDRYVPEVDTPTVMSDNCGGMYAVTEHLILSGHRRLGLLAFGPEGGVADRERRKGFHLALRDYDLPSTPVFEADVGTIDHDVTAREVIAAQLSADRGRPRFDGIVCMQDNMAFGAFLALKEAGLRVPDEIGLVGYDNLNSDIFNASGLRLTSVDQPAEEIGREAARLLIARIGGQPVESRAQHILLKPKLVIRESCGAAVAPSSVSK